MILKITRKIISVLISKPFNKIKTYYLFILDYKNFKRTSINNLRFEVKWKNAQPQLYDNTPETEFDAHYIYHPAWAARIVKQINPEFHVDISSTLAFSSILSAFIPIHFYDYRPANLTLSNLTSNKVDLMSLPFPDNSVKSLSCMHTVEHIGLGRYGDPINPNGDIEAINELKRVTSPEGSLLFVVPIGKSKLIFNGHRIYSYNQIISYFKDFELKEFTLIPDNAQKNGIVVNATEELANEQKYGCGCFWFIK